MADIGCVRRWEPAVGLMVVVPLQPWRVHDEQIRPCLGPGRSGRHQSMNRAVASSLGRRGRLRLIRLSLTYPDVMVAWNGGYTLRSTMGTGGWINGGGSSSALASTR